MSQRRQELGLPQLTLLIFSAVGGGPVGIEALVGASSFLAALLGLLLFPLLVAVPQALIVTELTLQVQGTNAGTAAWASKLLGLRFPAALAVVLRIIYNCSLASLCAQANLLYIQTASPSFDGYGAQLGLSAVTIVLAGSVCARALPAVTMLCKWVTLHTTLAFGVLMFWGLARADVSRAARGITKMAQPGLYANLLIFNSEGGDCVGSVASFVREPSQTVPRAMATAMVVTVLMYVSVLVGCYLGARDEPSDWHFGHFATVAGQLGGRGMQVWIIVAVCLVNLQTFVQALNAVVYEVQGAAQPTLALLPPWLGEASKREAPTRAVAACVLASVALAALPFQYNLALQCVCFVGIVGLQLASFAALDPTTLHALPAWLARPLVFVPLTALAAGLAAQTTVDLLMGLLTLVLCSGIALRLARRQYSQAGDRLLGKGIHL